MERATASGPVSAGPVFDLLDRITGFVAALGLSCMVVLVCLESTLRAAFNLSLGFSEEVTGYLVVLLTFLGAARALRSEALFRVEFLFDLFPARVRRVLVVVYSVLSLAICVVIGWKGALLVVSSLQRGKFAPTVLETPLWIPQLLLPVGFALLGVFLIEKIILSCHDERKGN